MRIPVRVIREEPGPGPGRRWDRFEDDDPDRYEDGDEMMKSKKQTAEPAAAEPDTGLAGEQTGEQPEAARDDLSPNQGPLDWKEKYVRLLADFENHRRHAEAERERLTGLGKETVLADVFPMIEHLEKAIAAGRAEGEANGLLKGIEIVYRELLNLLEKYGVERIPAKGEQFDPALHEAVAVIPSESHAEGVILEEIRPGFRRNGKLLRPASVTVAK